MALPTTGPISLYDVNVELGLSGTTTISMNQASVRTLFGVASGQISMSDGYGRSNYGNVATFTSQSSVDWTVPAGIISIWVKMWGAGGRGGSSAGGGGGFISGYVAVTPGSTVKIICGFGGTYDPSPEECDPGQSAFGGSDTVHGGAASVVYYNSSTYMMAGAGGAGARDVSGAPGGAGGGTNGVNGTGTNGGQGAQGATGGTGGVAGDANCDSTNGPNHSAPTLIGGNLVFGSYNRDGGAAPGFLVCGDPYFDCRYEGTSGGGGYAGGGGTDAGSGAGGGSSGAANFTDVTNTAGSGATPGGTGDTDYNSSYGGGGAIGVDGEQAYVVIRY